MSSRIRWSIVGVALIGLALSVAALRVHYRLLTDPTYVSPCDVSATFNCTAAYLSKYGSLAGVPTALSGVLWFGVVLLVALLAKPAERQSVEASYLFVLVLLAAPVVMFLGYVSYVRLRVGCPICLGTYACVIAILFLTSRTDGVPLSELPGRLATDLGGLRKRPLVFAILLVFLASVGTTAVWFPREGEVTSTAAPAVSADVRAQFEEAWAKQPRVDLGIPADGAKVVVVKFNDYECGGCRSAENFYTPLIKKMNDAQPGSVKFVMKDWVWSTSCNTFIKQTIPGHEAACVAAVAARVARDKGKYDEMASWLFGNQGVSPEAARAQASKILGLSPSDFDREAATKMAAVKQDIADGAALEVHATPTYFINGIRLPTQSMLAPEYFQLALDLEATRAN
ncbi:MAG: vitamin K epoxide reductase family protein [Acidobacteriota bacterium]